ncbi:S9 family peptidase [Deinococcus peraridilitoris]|uniref:Dipeptidyl aminopeptidase/acylaminoacyl peptidase n=1 Tax=Deinococcus peraridilitoris (strain DSM 19664 / LMG 22246 / CIP 109416 / KR-200) TaxID=937777 RepID=L0A0V1_DEIPD|nr:S9 family peptidase [Deinococcus peraridilitoris]AFZ66807.1 dipeptidyl aminopeptidase/acylaminoacyl peptidase [Deinococcus peraridilitoris DSM 19664]
MTLTAPISIEELAGLPTITAVTASRSGNFAAFYWDKTGRFELYVLNLRSRELRQVTQGEAPKAPRAGFAWSPDERSIVFSKDHDGDERQALYVLDVQSGGVRALDHQPDSMDYVVDVHPDGRLLIASTRAGQLGTFAYDLQARENAWTQLTHFTAPASPVKWSPDGEHFLFNSNETEDFKNWDAYLARADGSGARRIFSQGVGSQDRVGAWHPDGKRVAVTSDASGSGRVGVLTLGSGEWRWLSPQESATDEQVGEFSPDGTLLSVLRNREATLLPVLYDLQSGEARELQLPPGVTSSAQFVLGGEKLLTLHSSGARRAELLLYDLKSDTYEVLLPAEYGTIDPAVFVEGEGVRYPTFDGQDVPAVLHVPRGAEGRRLPAMVHVHGGPTAQFFRGFDLYAQFLVSRGFVVLSPNIRGSTGYGVAWRDANLKDWGGGDLEDVIAGADYLRSLPFVDPERVGIFGGSFGGYMSYLAAVRKPDAFKVSVPIVGITDLHRLYEDNSRVMPQLGYYFRSMMGDPEADADLWRDRSAITHAANLRAKMLILHGANDPRCPLTQASLFREKLMELGRREGQAPEDDFEYHEFHDEGHGAGDIQGKIRMYTLLADFLERRL